MEIAETADPVIRLKDGRIDGERMKNFGKIIVCCVALRCFSGCAYRYYLGMHGPSIKIAADIHEGVTEDKDCLGCHHPDRDPAGPPTSHPQFTGCLKCHNDELK